MFQLAYCRKGHVLSLRRTNNGTQAETMESAAAFQPFQALQSLQQTACTCPSPFSVPVQLTLGLTALHQAGAQSPCSPSSSSAPNMSCSSSRQHGSCKNSVHLDIGKDVAIKPPAPSLNSQTLGDGRLSVGTHMPLLAKRYSYLSVIGEGASAQVSTASHCHFMVPANCSSNSLQHLQFGH